METTTPQRSRDPGIVRREQNGVPKHRIARIINRIHLQPFERMLQKLQKEVDLLVSLVTTLDAFINSQTRLVIMVDGLDSCEQNKMDQLLDAFNLFFCSRQNAPFVVLLAYTPTVKNIAPKL
ncbi:hypothetical protein Mgra_00004228 [Meloidogyne graminicola]|uniref:KAP NTPase domain-containing protein n=1 Tax=Meloidogyne graminicola TaxID=189291 RepID=A0A8S9ZT53_9BILA|nr:hypothetical protein Mgra_00004228 [Meloidogyne graminicola]